MRQCGEDELREQLGRQREELRQQQQRAVSSGGPSGSGDVELATRLEVLGGSLG
jgi:hypothetical protein